MKTINKYLNNKLDFDRGEKVRVKYGICHNKVGTFIEYSKNGESATVIVQGTEISVDIDDIERL
jgi:hypothetical protein